MKLAFAFVMHCLMLHCFPFVFPTPGKYMYNRYKNENKLSLSKIESRIEFRNTENEKIHHFSVILHRHTAVTQHVMVYSCKRLYAQKQDQLKL